MSKSLTLLSTVLLLNMFSPVHAASSIDLSVKGLITPSACAPTLIHSKPTPASCQMRDFMKFLTAAQRP